MWWDFLASSCITRKLVPLLSFITKGEPNPDIFLRKFANMSQTPFSYTQCISEPDNGSMHSIVSCLWGWFADLMIAFKLEFGPEQSKMTVLPSHSIPHKTVTRLRRIIGSVLSSPLLSYQWFSTTLEAFLIIPDLSSPDSSFSYIMMVIILQLYLTDLKSSPLWPSQHLWNSSLTFIPIIFISAMYMTGLGTICLFLPPVNSL